MEAVTISSKYQVVIPAKSENSSISSQDKKSCLSPITVLCAW